MSSLSLCGVRFEGAAAADTDETAPDRRRREREEGERVEREKKR